MRVLGIALRFMLRFFFRPFSRIMGCFFGCFRFRDDRHLPTTRILASSSHSNKFTEVVISGNRSSSLFQSEERECSPRHDRKIDVGAQRDDQGLKDEAKFLKACGTLAGTPAEIRKASEKLKVSPACGKNSEPSSFHSWLPNTSIENLQLDVQTIDPPSPIELCQEWGNGMDSLEHTPSSCISNEQNTQGDSLGSTESRSESLHTAERTEKNPASISPWPATGTLRKNKSVRFECDTDLSSCGSSSDYGEWHMNKTKSPSIQSACKPSPYPTPLKLFDAMQTPGTVYPATLEDLPNGKPRVRSQFVYGIYNPWENISCCKMLEDKDFNPGKDSGELSDSVGEFQNATPAPEKGLKKISSENETEVETGLSCLSPASIIQKEKNKSMETAISEIPHFRNTPSSRPIIGMVAAHWNEDENSHIPPKFRDGNGIPNTTTKYKEDQKVNWHATPFEERLEKVLSDNGFNSRRNAVFEKPIAFDETEESDTARSQIQSSTQPELVASCSYL